MNHACVARPFLLLCDVCSSTVIHDNVHTSVRVFTLDHLKDAIHERTDNFCRHDHLASIPTVLLSLHTTKATRPESRYNLLHLYVRFVLTTINRHQARRSRPNKVPQSSPVGHVHLDPIIQHQRHGRAPLTGRRMDGRVSLNRIRINLKPLLTFVGPPISAIPLGSLAMEWGPSCLQPGRIGRSS